MAYHLANRFISCRNNFGKCKINFRFVFFAYFVFIKRNSVKSAFQTQPQQRKSRLFRLNSTDCSNEIEDDMLPWLLEDLFEDSTVVSIQ